MALARPINGGHIRNEAGGEEGEKSFFLDILMVTSLNYY